VLSASGSQQATGLFGEPILLICHSHGLNRHVDTTMQGFFVWVGRIGVLNSSSCDGLSKSESSAGRLVLRCRLVVRCHLYSRNDFFFGCYTAAQLALQLHQDRTQGLVLFSSVQSHLFSSPIGAQTLKMPVPHPPPNVRAYTRTPSHNHTRSAVGAQIISLRSANLFISTSAGHGRVGDSRTA